MIITGAPSTLAASYNAFPYTADGHLLLVPCRNKLDKLEFPHDHQRMNLGMLKGLLSIAAALPEWLIGFSAIRAGASQDHWHAHLLRCETLPVERALPVRVDAFCYPFGYPAGCLIVANATSGSLMPVVERLRSHKVPFNLMLRGETAYVFGRRHGAELVPEFPTGTIAISELCGRLLVSHEAIWERLTESIIAEALRKATYPVEKLLDLVA